MKVTYELYLDDKEHPKYVERGARLFEWAADRLRAEAAGGVVVSSEKCAVGIGTEYLVITKIEAK